MAMEWDRGLMDTQKQVFLTTSSKKSTKERQIISIQGEENLSSVFYYEWKSGLYIKLHMTYLLLFDYETNSILWKFFMSIILCVLIFSIIISYAGPAHCDFLGQPSYISVSLSSIQASEKSEACYLANLGTKRCKMKWEIWKAKCDIKIRLLFSSTRAKTSLSV